MVERRRMFEELISKARALGASDVHLEAETPIVARIRGELQIVGGTLSAERLAQASQALLGAEGWALFGTRGSADMSASRSRSACSHPQSRICAPVTCTRIFAGSSRRTPDS